MSDKQLMFSVRDGDLDKLGILFQRYNRVLYNFFLRLTNNEQASEDLVQEVFFRMLKYRHTYKGTSEFTVWMFQIARNARNDHFRKQKPEHAGEGDSFESQDLNPGEKIEKAQAEHLLHRALATLREDDREVLMLSRFQNMRYKEIAKVYGCVEGTIKARVFKATQRLRDAFFELSGEKA